MASDLPLGVCPVTGLQILQRPEWKDVQVRPNLKLSIRIIGKVILDVKMVGARTMDTQGGYCEACALTGNTGMGFRGKR